MGSLKDTAIDFLQLSASGRSREAFAEYAAAEFGHHNPYYPGTAEALMIGMEENARQNPQKRLDVLRALEDGDLVAIHSRVRQKPDDVGAVVVHLFRFAGVKIVELWDVGQPVPAESVNDNGMF